MVNLDVALAAPRSVFDGLLTLATGVVQVMSGFHVAGGITAMLHGAFRMADPDSPLTKIAASCRKALTPGLTVIQESVKLVAPLPDNECGGLRDALCEATHQITGVEVGGLKHQLFGPGNVADQPLIQCGTQEAPTTKATEATEAPESPDELLSSDMEQLADMTGPPFAESYEPRGEAPAVTDEEIAAWKRDDDPWNRYVFRLSI